jgi:hypothetical protein
MTDTAAATVEATEANEHGYRTFRLGGFTFARDEHFAHVEWPTGRHVLSVEAFLKALMRDVAWNFFYGIVNFDAVLGTMNHYGTVDLFAGRYNDAYRKAELDHQENFPSEQIMATFKAMLADWTNDGYDPFAAPQETGSPFGEKRGDNVPAITRTRVTARRMVGVPGDEPLRSDDTGHAINRMFADVDQDEPDVRPEPGYEDEVASFNLYAYLSTSRGTRRWSRCAGTACTARPPRSSSCPSSTATIGWSGSSSSRTRSTGRSRTARPASRGPTW